LNNHLAGKFTTGKFAAALESFDSWTSANEFLENDFEPLVFRTYPEIGEIKNRLLDNGARFASLSGSGSTVFGIFTEETEALEAGKQFSPPIQTFLTSPINR
jgi:4-diphosphocytidyl-2-C-methyl-D-erythritol kinase